MLGLTREQKPHQCAPDTDRLRARRRRQPRQGPNREAARPRRSTTRQKSFGSPARKRASGPGVPARRNAGSERIQDAPAHRGQVSMRQEQRRRKACGIAKDHRPASARCDDRENGGISVMNRIGKRKRTLRGRICSKRNIVLRNDIERKRLRKSTRPRVHPLEAGSQGARHRKRANTIAQIGERTRNNPGRVAPRGREDDQGRVDQWRGRAATATRDDGPPDRQARAHAGHRRPALPSLHNAKRPKPRTRQ